MLTRLEIPNLLRKIDPSNGYDQLLEFKEDLNNNDALAVVRLFVAQDGVKYNTVYIIFGEGDKNYAIITVATMPYKKKYLFTLRSFETDAEGKNIKLVYALSRLYSKICEIRVYQGNLQGITQ